MPEKKTKTASWRERGTAAGPRLTRREFIVAGSGAVACAALSGGCGGDDEKPEKKAADPTASGTPWAGTEVALDLRDAVHLAEIDHCGEFVDFGTAARYKYTLGSWMTGWENDTSMNGVSFTWASKSPSRLFFHLDEPKKLVFELRAKPGGTDELSFWLNEHPITRVNLSKSDWGTYRVETEAEHSVAGENYMKLIYATADDEIDDEPASIAVDYLRIIPEGVETPKQFDPPGLDGIRQRFTSGERQREALMLSAPTRLSYYVEIPPGTNLCTAAAAARASGESKGELRLTATAIPADGGEPVELLKSSYGDAKWHEEMVSLDAVAGELVRLEIEVDGPPGARLALGDPALRHAPPKIEQPSRKPKNAIVLLIDTLRADKLGVYDKTRVKSPAFDKFAGECTIFDRCQANSNWTKPSCATLLTGLHPDSHKARGHSSLLGSSVRLASEIFRSAGFATGAFIANGYLAAEFGFDRGWSRYVNYIRESKPTEAEHVYEDTLKFIEANREKPFFTYIQTIDPHVPYDPPSEDLKLYDAAPYNGPISPRSTGNLLEDFKRKRVELDARDRRRLESLYDGEVTYHDRHFGRFLDKLHKLGVLDDTVILVCSDHGEEFFEHESVGHGHTLFQELLHVPLAIRAPGCVPSGKRVDREVTLADVLPTALSAVGVPVPREIEGGDLSSIARGSGPDPISTAFSSFWSEADDRNLSWAALKGPWKLYMKGPVRTYLYNLSKDPEERTDADDRYPLALRALRIATGQFIGAPDKHDWYTDKISAEVVKGPEAEEEKTDIPGDLKEQLRKLGYMQ